MKSVDVVDHFSLSGKEEEESKIGFMGFRPKWNCYVNIVFLFIT